jgi:hypothetical protein
VACPSNRRCGLPEKNFLAKGRLKAGELNKTEQAYEARLKLLLQAGEILWYKPFGLTFKLADDTRYTPDFIVLAADGVIECHEVKSFWQGDAKVKIKVAAALFPFRFLAVKKAALKNGGGWTQEDF